MRRTVCPPRPSLAVLVFVSSALSGCGDPPPDPTWASLTGEVAVAKANCLACHAASDAVVTRIRTASAPRLEHVGDRLTPAYLRAFLSDPHTTHRATRMPDVLHGLAAEEKHEAVEDLVHYLAARRAQGSDPMLGAAPLDVLPSELERGAALFRTAGCAVCHGKGERGRYARMTWHAPLAAFIASPLEARPAGLMPDCHLDPVEARAVAAWLLEAHAMEEGDDGEPVHRRVRSPGLLAEYIERPMSADGPGDDSSGLRAAAIAPSITIDVPGLARREEDFALRFEGAIEIPRSGRYTFFLGSDDGSTLAIDGRTLIDHSGSHSFGFKSQSIELEAGWHAIHLVYWEISGENELELEWQGPGIPRGRVDPARFAHDAIRLLPPDSGFTSDPTRVRHGAERFRALGCASCHESEIAPPTSHAPSFASLDPTRGCLASLPPAHVPRFHWDEATRAALLDTVSHARNLEAPLASDLVIQHAMHRIGCVQCHARDGVGGPTRESESFFVADGSAELGDQGRFPPALDGVGDKFRPEALARQIAEGEKVRPYMLTRMPVFGPEATEFLPPLFTAVDRDRRHDADIPFSHDAAVVGRQLVGSGGVSCITCHTANGRPSLGVPAIDLAVMHRRLRPGWFLAFLDDPSLFTPGTRMTRFWMPGERIFPNHLHGDPQRQREAIWNYLSLGESMPTAPGLQSPLGAYELTPASEPIVFGTFMRGVSPRTICVGYPDLIHAAFDAEHARLAKAWRGSFIDARGTWDGRAGQLELPLSQRVIDLPPGPSFAVLSERDDPWPDAPAHYKGIERDSNRRPAFVVEVDGVACAERPIPSVRPGGAWLRRAIEGRHASDRNDVYFRAAVGESIERSGEVWIVNGATRIVTDATGAFVRSAPSEAGTQRELLIPVDFRYVEGGDPPFRANFFVEMDW